MNTTARRTITTSLLTLTLALGACGGDSTTTGTGACGRSNGGVTQCTVVVGGSCSAGQYCNQAMLTCSPGCTSDDNCASGESCVRNPGEAVGACARCATTPTAACGNGRCEAGETTASCPADCPAAGAACGNGRCEAGETPASCAADCQTSTNPSCPSVAGTYTVSVAPGLPAQCAPPSSTVTIAQSGCAVTVTGLYDVAVTFPINEAGLGTGSYNAGGVPGTVTFTFTPGMLQAVDMGVAVGCAIVGTRNP